MTDVVYTDLEYITYTQCDNGAARPRLPNMKAGNVRTVVVHHYIRLHIVLSLIRHNYQVN